MGFDIPQDVTAFLVLGAISETEIANEEIIGILTIAWRCLHAEITAARLDGRGLNLERAQKRAWCMIHSRLNAYGHACRTFCVERKYSGRKCKLPKKLSKRKIIKVDQDGSYEIHPEIINATKRHRGHAID